MKPLHDMLDLGDEARLTGVVLMPTAKDVSTRSGRFVMQTALGLSEASDVAGHAVARMMRDAVAIINGVNGDGREWFAIFEHFQADSETGSEASRAGLVRAMELTGVGAMQVRGHDFDWVDLHELYDNLGADDVDDWGNLDLLLGLILNLSRGDLPKMVHLVTNPTLPAEARAEHRSQKLHELLYDWASQYQGPEQAG